MYAVQKQDLFGFSSELVTSHPHIAFDVMKELEKTHGKQYRIIKI